MRNDIIKRFIERMMEAQPTLSEEFAQGLEKQLRHEFSGERVYINKRDEYLQVEIMKRFTGRNVDKLANELQVSRATIYRVIRNRKIRGAL